MKLKINFDVLKLLLSALLFIIAIIVPSDVAKIILFVLSYIIASYEIYINAIKNIAHGEIFDENFLMIIATIGAFAIQEYFEAVLVILLYSLGEYLSDMAVEKSEEKIVSLMNLSVDYANVKTGESYEKIEAQNISIGDICFVKKGEKIPIDGEIVSGETYLNTSSLTGESAPLAVKIGDSVLSGCINLDSFIEIRATKTYENSTASKLLKLIKDSSKSGSKTQSFITKFCKFYTPIVVLLAVLVAVVPLFFGQSFNVWLYRALQFLVISCPCALVISVPLGFFCGVGKASSLGILVKGTNVLEEVSNIKTVVFDKTGTLTDAEMTVSNIYSIIGDENLLELASLAEYNSNHPLAKAIVGEYSHEIKNDRISDFKEQVGGGVICKIDGDDIIAGKFPFLIENGVDAFDEADSVNQVVYLSKNGKFIGYIELKDKIKQDAKICIQNLGKIGINDIYILSGDNKNIVGDVASSLNISKYYGDLLPDEKLEVLDSIQNNSSTCYVGDGLNDVPCLLRSNIGIAMGGVSQDACIEASDVVLINKSLEGVPKLIKTARFTKKIVKFNIFFALTVKFVVMLLALCGVSPLWLAVLADVGVTLFTVLISLIILIKK